MALTIDISELAEQLAALQRRSQPTSVAVVVPLAEGKDEIVWEFLGEGPPFDPAAIGLDGHKVFLTGHEAIFVFDVRTGPQDLERILAEPEFWDVASSWQRCASAKPRLGVEAYSWP